MGFINFLIKSFKMCPTCSYHLRGMKLLIKYELLQSSCHVLILLLKFKINVFP